MRYPLRMRWGLLWMMLPIFTRLLVSPVVFSDVTLLNRTAYQLGVDKLATGHNLDDEIQSFFMSFTRADVRRFGKFGPSAGTYPS